MDGFTYIFVSLLTLGFVIIMTKDISSRNRTISNLEDKIKEKNRKIKDLNGDLREEKARSEHFMYSLMGEEIEIDEDELLEVMEGARYNYKSTLSSVELERMVKESIKEFKKKGYSIKKKKKSSDLLFS